MVGTQQLSELFFASSNENKFQEAERILTNLGVKVNFSKTTLEEIQSSSLSEIAEQKAISAYELIQKPVIIEDDGLFIDSLNNPISGLMVGSLSTECNTFAAIS